MSLLGLTSVAGSPGVTTTALGLTLAWPGDAVLMDADRSAPHTILAGHLAGQATHGHGMQGLLQAHRERLPMAVALASEWRHLPDLPRPTGVDAPGERRFVPGFTHLGSVDLFEGAWPSVVDAAREASFDVIVDAGRTGHRGLPANLVAGAGAVALVCRTSLSPLAALRLHLGPLVETGPPGRVGLLVVGPGRPYGVREVAEQFGVPVLAEVAWDAAAAAELHEGAPVGKRWPRTGLARSLETAAAALSRALHAGLEEAS